MYSIFADAIFCFFKGNISLARELNRETLDGYSLVVVASKDGKQAVGYVSSY